MSNSPILIPIKQYSQRCPGKNKILLPYIADFLKKEKRLCDAIVISDSKLLLSVAKSLSLKTHFEIRKENQDEIVSCWNYLSQLKYDSFFLCPVTQPFKSNGLFDQMEVALAQKKIKLDFVCSATKTPNRQIFNICDNTNGQTKFMIPSTNRKGTMCSGNLMIDGALYMIKTSFLKQVVMSDDTNASWWNGKFNCVINNAPFIDIDTKSDMEKFMFLKSFFE